MKRQPPHTTPVQKRHDPKPLIERQGFDRENIKPPEVNLKDNKKIVRFSIKDFIKNNEVFNLSI